MKNASLKWSMKETQYHLIVNWDAVYCLSQEAIGSVKDHVLNIDTSITTCWKMKPLFQSWTNFKNIVEKEMFPPELTSRWDSIWLDLIRLWKVNDVFYQVQLLRIDLFRFKIIKCTGNYSKGDKSNSKTFFRNSNGYCKNDSHQWGRQNSYRGISGWLSNCNTEMYWKVS